ncbi:MAG: type II secretion system protein [Phycisphaerales bacterium]
MRHSVVRPTAPRAFTIIELLVVVSIIALLIGILLPAIGKARDQAKQTASLANLRNLGTAHGSYAAEWNDRQFTLVNDNISSFGNSRGQAFEAFYQSNGGGGENATHPPLILGWARVLGDGDYLYFAYRTHEGGEEQHGPLNTANCGLMIPINFDNPLPYFGSFRIPNAKQFNNYVSGKFYDRVFYAPKDTIVWNSADGGDSRYSCFDDPGEYCDRPDVNGFGEIPTWSSYCLSPAAMFSPDVLKMRRVGGGSNTGGYRNPWTLGAGFRSPAYGQARYPSLKTHMIEHHWLQNRRAECNAGITNGSYLGCEPYYFNAAWESSPMTLFYDGHVGSVGVRKAMRADGRIKAQVNGFAGLWSRDTPFGQDGYYSDVRYDAGARTSFHVLTSDGIFGRDIISE